MKFRIRFTWLRNLNIMIVAMFVKIGRVSSIWKWNVLLTLTTSCQLYVDIAQRWYFISRLWRWHYTIYVIVCSSTPPWNCIFLANIYDKQARTWISNVICPFVLLSLSDLIWEVIVCFLLLTLIKLLTMTVEIFFS